MKKLLGITIAVCLLIVSIPTNFMPVKAEVIILHEGKSGDLNWSIDSEGLLAISGVGNYETNYIGFTPEWCEYRDDIKSAKVEVSGIENTNNMFYQCYNLTRIDLSGLDTKKVSDMSFMFSSCTKLTQLDLSSFETENVTSMSYMFSGCESLTELNLNCFDTKNVEDMDGMFYQCCNLTKLNLGRFDTKNVTDMYAMFYGCEALTKLDLQEFNTANVTDMGYMFYRCAGLNQLDLSNFNTGNTEYMYSMFEKCTNLTDINLNRFQTKNVTDMESMFCECIHLVNLDLSSFDTRNVTDMDFIFDGCGKLTVIQTPKNVNCSAKLPNGIWADLAGKVFSELPHGISTSVELKKYANHSEIPDITQQTTKKTEQNEREKLSKIAVPAKAKIKKVKSGKKKVTIIIKRVKDAKGYLIQFSKKKNFKRVKNTYTTKTKLIIRKLQSNKKYYFRVKAYKLDGVKQLFSKKWSRTKKVKVK